MSIRAFLLCTCCLIGLAAADPAADGPYRVISSGYDFGATAWSDPVSRERCGFSARVDYPAELGSGPFPLLFILHGRHQGIYKPGESTAINAWPPSPGWLPIPNAAGYDWITGPLASHGCIVVSVEANAVTAFDTFYGDYGDGIRQRLVADHLRLWQRLASEDAPPFGDRFVGRVDLDRVALLGHSRGGAVMARLARQLAAEGEVGLAALGLIAATDTPRVDLPEVPTAIIAGQLDGDVTNLECVHYFDDARWQSSSPRYLAILDGGNHNFFNRYWDPDEFDAGAKDDNLSYDATWQLSGDAQRQAAAEWLAAFYRHHLFDEQRWQELLIGEESLPSGAACRISWQPAASQRRLINSGRQLSHKQHNELGGAVSTDGSLTTDMIGGGYPQPDHLLVDHHTTREVHWSGDQPFFRAAPGLRQHLLNWSSNDGVWANSIPASDGDWRSASHLLFRLGVNFEDDANTDGQMQDLTVRLIDADGDHSDVRLRDHSSAGIWPIGTDLTSKLPSYRNHMPRLLLYQARVPLSAFSDVALAQIRHLELRFDRRASGEIVLTDLALGGTSDRPPSADGILLSNSDPAPDTVVTASLDNAVDPDGDALSIAWHWGDGATGSGASATHRYSAAGRYVITALLSAGGVSTRLQRSITVTPAGGNRAPTCASFSNIAIDQGESPAAIGFTVGDPDGPVSQLRVWATSNDSELVDRHGLAISGSDSLRSLQIQPYQASSGSARITVHVSDGIDTTTRNFRLDVSAATAAPVITWSSSVFLNENNVFTTDPRANERWLPQGQTHTLNLNVYDRDTPVYVDGEWLDSLTGQVTSDDPAILPAAKVAFARRPNSIDIWEASLDLTDAPLGVALLTFSVTDDTGNSDSVTLLTHIVEADNQAPVIDAVGGDPDPVIQGTGIAVATEVHDPDAGPAPLTVQWRLRGPIPAGFDPESLGWWFAPSGGPNTRSWFGTANPSQLVDGTYNFEVVAHDGLAQTSETFTVAVDNRPEDLVAWWPLDETSGTRFDLWTLQLHLAPVGGVGRAIGQRGLAAAFDGSGVLHCDSQAQATELGRPAELTCALWCRPSSHGGVVQLIGKHGPDNPGWAVQLVDGVPRLLLHDSSGQASALTGSTALPIGAWTHLVATYDSASGAATLYRDGALASSATLTTDLIDSAAPLTLGGQLDDQTPTATFIGNLDAVTIGKAVIDQDRVESLHQAENGNQAPIVDWVAPRDRQAFASGSAVDLELATVDPEGDPVSVQLFLLGDTLANAVRSRLLATIDKPPYRFRWSEPDDGSHVLVAVASDGQRHSSTTWRFIHVGEPLQLLPIEALRQILLNHPIPGWFWDESSGAGTIVPASDLSQFQDLDPSEDHLFEAVPSGDQ